MIEKSKPWDAMNKIFNKNKNQGIIRVSVVATIVMVLVVMFAVPAALPLCGTSGSHLPHPGSASEPHQHSSTPCASAHASAHQALIDGAYFQGGSPVSSEGIALATFALILLVVTTRTFSHYRVPASIVLGDVIRHRWREVSSVYIEPIRRALRLGTLQQQVSDTVA